jgi:tRNA threonylcarbamoyladenosine biosynthesis protein TsaB
MLLAVDTSTRSTGIALYDGAQVLAESMWVSADFHTVELAPAVAEMWKRTGASPDDLQVLAAATGPGSFTGLRIGLALVKGLALARHVPLVGIPTLDVLAASQPVHADRQLAAVLRAGRGRLAVSWYTAIDGQWRPTGESTVHTLQSLNDSIQKPTLVSGELTAEQRRLLKRNRKNVRLASPVDCVRRPAKLAQLAWERWQAGKVDDPASLAPIYLHYQDSIPT